MAFSDISQIPLNQQIALSSASAKNQMAFQERMSNTAIQRQVKDLQKAGMNPVLATRLGGASTPSGAEGDYSGDQVLNLIAQNSASAINYLGSGFLKLVEQKAKEDDPKLTAEQLFRYPNSGLGRIVDTVVDELTNHSIGWHIKQGSSFLRDLITGNANIQTYKEDGKYKPVIIYGSDAHSAQRAAEAGQKVVYPSETYTLRQAANNWFNDKLTSARNSRVAYANASKAVKSYYQTASSSKSSAVNTASASNNYNGRGHSARR